jgi:hypothetical protein
MRLNKRKILSQSILVQPPRPTTSLSRTQDLYRCMSNQKYLQGLSHHSHVNDT